MTSRQWIHLAHSNKIDPTEKISYTYPKDHFFKQKKFSQQPETTHFLPKEKMYYTYLEK